ncbi:hypothetical protein B7463_g3581, partial [Scytalidium lignicola]
MLFVSISSVAASSVTPIPETIITDPLAALPMGYAESKYVSERILDYASTVFPRVNILIVRVDQVTGPAYAPGSWNKWEWFPSLVVSSLYLNILLDSLGKGEEVIDWVPIDFLADALVKLAIGSTKVLDASGARVFHPLNPQPMTWDSLKPIVIDALSRVYDIKGQNKSIAECLSGPGLSVFVGKPGSKMPGLNWRRCWR